MWKSEEYLAYPKQVWCLHLIRDYWRKKAKKTNDPLARSAYKNFKREVRHEIRFAEKEFVADQIQNNPQ